MKYINTYIIEKLHLNKDIEEQGLSKSELIDEINYQVSNCFTSVSQNKWDSSWYDDQKAKTFIVKKTWFKDIRYKTEKQKVEDMVIKIKTSLKDILPEHNIVYWEVSKNDYCIRIYLYDPE